MSEPATPKDPNDAGSDPAGEGKRVLDAWGMKLPPELQAEIEAQAQALKEAADNLEIRKAAQEFADSMAIFGTGALAGLREVIFLNEMASGMREAEKAARSAFVADRIAELPQAERPTKDEAEDLERRLLAVLERLNWRTPTAAKVDRWARHNPVLAREVAAAWSLFDETARRRGPDRQGWTDYEGALLEAYKAARVVKSGAPFGFRYQADGTSLEQDPAEWPTLELIRAQIRTGAFAPDFVRSYRVLNEMSCGDAPSTVELAGPQHRVTLAYVWPGLFRRWRREHERRDAELRKDIEAAYETLRSRHAEARAAFLRERIAELPPAERPTDEESRDLERRLLEAVESARFPEERTHAALDRVQVAQTPEIMLGHYRVTLACLWPEVLGAWRLAHAERLAARAVLLEAANREKDPDELAAAPEAEGRLEQAVKEWKPEAAKAVRVPPKEGLEALGMRNGMFALDADLAAFVASLPVAGAKEAAEEWRKKWRADWSQTRTPREPECWKRWEDALRLPRVLARVLWPLRVRVELDRERGRKDAAGVIAPVLTNLAQAARVGLLGARRGAQVDWLTDHARITDKNGRPVGELRIDGPSVDGRVIRLSALGTLSAQRVLRWAIWEGYQKRFIQAAPDFSTLWVEGAEKALAKQFGLNGQKAAGELREAFDAWASVWIDTPKGDGRIFAVHHHKPAPGRPARLEVHLLGPLRPGYVQDELAAHRIAEDKRIVPVPMPSQLPPMVGRENERAPQAQLQLLAMREFRTKAEELADRGAVAIPEKRWRELAEEAALPLRMLADVLNAFTSGQGTAPAAPFLTRPGKDDFGLADAYERERTAILSAAGKTKRGRARGRKAARRK